MKRHNTTATVLNLSDKLKPFLIKFLPIGMLRRIKKGIVNSSMSKLENQAVEPFARAANPDGINLIGYIRGEIGLGESCRLVAGNLLRSGLDFTVYNYEQVSAMAFGDTSWEHFITDATPYNINLIHIQPYELPLAFSRIGRETWDKRYNIVYWLWELEQFPAQWENALILADEIWTPSEFAGSSIRKVTQKPVYTMPYGLKTPECGNYGREDFGLPADRFLFLCVYDCNSFIERKNPTAAIRAFKKAFASDDKNVGIVIKLNNPQKKDIKKISEELPDSYDVHIIADVLEKTKVHALIACADAYVSLHRSEGFGLVPAEAMMLGTPVIATNWSANTEFMDENSACLVDYSFVTIEKDHGPYEAGNRWADPDIEQAAEYMRKLYEDKDFRQRIAENAKAHIMEKLAPERMAALIGDRIAEIYSNKK